MKKITALFPGSFKLLHPGHISLIEKYIKHEQVDKLILIISKQPRDFITSKNACDWANMILTQYNFYSKIEIIESDEESPVTYAFKYIKNNPGNYVWVQSNKDNEQGIIDRLHKIYKETNTLINIFNLDISHDPLKMSSNENYSSTYIRECLTLNEYDKIINLFEFNNNIKYSLKLFLKSITPHKNKFNKHLSHPYEDDSLTFKDINDIIDLLHKNQLTLIEKTDGLNFKISFKNNRFIGAKNKTQIKNFGENSFVRKSLSKDINNTRDFIYDDILNILNKNYLIINNKNLNNFFKNGSIWLNVEILDSRFCNVITYTLNTKLIIHNVLESDKEGNLFYTNIKTDFIIKNMRNIDIDKLLIITSDNIRHSYGIDTREILSCKELVNDMCNNCTDEKLLNYKQKRFKEYINNRFIFDFNEYEEPIYNRIINNDKSFPINKYPLEYKNFIELINIQEAKKYVYKDLDKLFIILGNSILKNYNDSHATSNNKENIYKKLLFEISDIVKNGDEEENAILKYNIERLNNSYIINNIEGYIFEYKNKFYKLTGSFSPINQILGIRKYKRN